MLAKKAAVLDWREELIELPRRPRCGWESVEKLLSHSQRAQVSLRERKNYTEVILRFPSSSHQLSSRVQRAYSELGMDLPSVFAEVIWRKPSNGSRSLWSELVRVGFNAYREAWLHFQKLLYVGHFHPKVDALLCEELTKLRKATRLSAGRHHVLEEEKQSRRRRFRQLVETANEIYRVVQTCVQNDLGVSATRRAVFHKIRGKRIDDFILRNDRGMNKSPFERIPYGKQGRAVHLHDPTSWKPHQLAIALLSLERDCEYATIERETAIVRKQQQSRKATAINRRIPRIPSTQAFPQE